MTECYLYVLPKLYLLPNPRMQPHLGDRPSCSPPTMSRVFSATFSAQHLQFTAWQLEMSSISSSTLGAKNFSLLNYSSYYLVQALDDETVVSCTWQARLTTRQSIEIQLNLHTFHLSHHPHGKPHKPCSNSAPRSLTPKPDCDSTIRWLRCSRGCPRRSRRRRRYRRRRRRPRRQIPRRDGNRLQFNRICGIYAFTLGHKRTGLARRNVTGSGDPKQACRWLGRASILTLVIERGAGCRGAHEDCGGVGSDGFGFAEGADGGCVS